MFVCTVQTKNPAWGGGVGNPSRFAFLPHLPQPLIVCGPVEAKLGEGLHDVPGDPYK